MFVIIDLKKIDYGHLTDDELEAKIESILSDVFNDMPKFNTHDSYWKLDKIKEIGLGRNDFPNIIQLSHHWNTFIWEQFQAAVADLTVEHSNHGLNPESKRFGPIAAALNSLQGVFTPEARAAILSKNDSNDAYMDIDTIMSGRQATMMELIPERFAWATIKLVQKKHRP